MEDVLHQTGFDLLDFGDQASVFDGGVDAGMVAMMDLWARWRDGGRNRKSLI